MFAYNAYSTSANDMEAVSGQVYFIYISIYLAFKVFILIPVC